jgi:hypothetical protein
MNTQKVIVYDPDTKKEATIPLAELAPGMVKGLFPGGRIMWMDGRKAKHRAKPVHPPFDEVHRQIFRQLKRDLDEVVPNSLEEMEYNFRRDDDPEREITRWRWIAYRFNQFTASGKLSLDQKKDVFQLCLNWTMTRDESETLATTPLLAFTQAEARLLISALPLTSIKFFGGVVAEKRPDLHVVDYASIKSLDAFKHYVEQANLIVALDWNGRSMEILYGRSVLTEVAQTGQSREVVMVAFAIHFESEQRERLAAAVMVAKGHCELNGEIHRMNDGPVNGSTEP